MTRNQFLAWRAGYAYIWNVPGLPQKGWECVDVTDLDEPSHKCEMCGNEQVRFVHHMVHETYPYPILVGCVCAEKICEGYSGAKVERALRNRTLRYATFLRGWKWSQRGNLYKKKSGVLVVIGGHPGPFWLSVDHQLIQRRFASTGEAARYAFDQIESWKYGMTVG